MFERRSLKLPITLGVIMIVTLVVLIIGWILLAIFGAMRESQYAPAYWIVLTIGSALFILVLVGVISYLVLTIKAFNLNRRQSNFVDSVTHELKSPIASLKLCLQTLRRRSLGENERATFIGYMLEDVERLDDLITHLLAAGNIDARTSGPDTETFDLAGLVSEIVTSLKQRHDLPADSIDIHLKTCPIKANRIDIDMIVRNLLDNAIRYGGKPLKVVVNLVVPREGPRLTIEDNGDGIPRSFRSKVFGRFVRLGSELERKQTGTGLGLYIVRTLVDRLGGSVSIPDGSMSGAKFEVRFPADLLDPGPNGSASPPQLVDPAGVASRPGIQATP